MQVLIFALLALAVSAHNYGYGGSYSSYPSSYYGGYGGYGGSNYGIGYGNGYGSYGSDYGSGISYVLGGAGSYSSGGLGGYATAYKPAVYQTARYSYQYPHGTAAAYKSGSHGYSTAEGPAKITYTQDFSGIAGYSGQSGIPIVTGFEELKSVAPKGTAVFTHGVKSEYKSGAHGAATDGPPGRISFTRYFSRLDKQSGLPKSQEAVRVSTFPRPIAPAAAVAGKQSSGYIHHAGGVHKIGAQEFSGVGGPQISFTRGGAALRQPDTKVIPSAKLTAPVGSFAPKISSGFSGASGSIQKSEGHGVKGSGGPAHISFIQDFSKSSGQSHKFEIKPEIAKFQHISPVAGGIASWHSSTHGAGSLHKTQSHGISGVGGQSEITFAQGIAGVSGQPGRIAGAKPVAGSGDKLKAGDASAFAKQTSTHGADSLHKAENNGTAGVGEQGEIIFAQDIAGVSGHSGHRITGVRPVEASGGASPFAKQPSTHGAGSLHKTGTQGFSGVSKQGEITFAQDIAAVSGQSGHHSAGAIPAVSSFDKLNTRGVAIVPKQSSGYVHRAATIQKSGGHGFSAVAGPQISFTLGGAALHQPGSKLVSFDKLAAPAAGVAPKPSYGQSGVSGALSKNTAQGFSTASGPSRISFTQDFSRISSHVGIKPFVSSFDKVNIPTFPGADISRGYQSGQRNKATFATAVDSRSPQTPFAGIPFSQTPKQIVVQQPAFTAIDGTSPAHGSFIGSLLSHGAGDKSIFLPGHPGYSVDYKHTIASVEGLKNDKSRFDIVPETTFGNDRPSVFKHVSVAGDGIAGGRLYGVHHSSEEISGQGELGGAVSSYKVSSAGHAGDKSSIFVAVPAESYDDEKTSIFLPSSGVAPSGTFAIDKGSVLKLSGGVDSAVSSHGQHGHAGYRTITAPFKSYYSNSYPGYSQISGESPRYGFSHDRNLLYSSPYLTSPFSYSYAHDKQSQI